MDYERYTGMCYTQADFLWCRLREIKADAPPFLWRDLFAPTGPAPDDPFPSISSALLPIEDNCRRLGRLIENIIRESEEAEGEYAMIREAERGVTFRLKMLREFALSQNVEIPAEVADRYVRYRNLPIPLIDDVFE